MGLSQYIQIIECEMRHNKTIIQCPVLYITVFSTVEDKSQHVRVPCQLCVSMDRYNNVSVCVHIYLAVCKTLA